MSGWNEPAEEHDGPGEMVEIIQDAPYLDEETERALRPPRVTGQKLPHRKKDQ